jgi:CBS domain-containing protein
MLLKDVCTVNVVCCDGETRAAEAAQLMRQHHVGDLVVVADPDGDRSPLGIVTDRDLVVEVLAKGADPGRTTLASLMHRPVVLAQETEDTSTAVERMRAHGVRRMPVVDRHGAVVGIVTLDDLLRLFVRGAGTLLEVIEKEQSHERHIRR